MCDGQKISIRVEVNEEEKSVVILIPWERLATMDGAEVLKWLTKAAQVKEQWEGKGLSMQLSY